MRFAICLASVVLFFLIPTFSLRAQQIMAALNTHYARHLLPKAPLSDSTSSDTSETGEEVELWREWRTVKNYSFGKNRGSIPMIADLRALHPYFRDRVKELMRICEEKGIHLAVVESYRTPAKQSEYYAMGRKYTSSRGGKSRHQYGLAVDVVPVVDSVAVWNNRVLWNKIGAVGEQLGLRWGGRWRVLYDPGHFEWSGGLTKDQLQRGFVPEIPGEMAGQYPNLEEDLQELRLYWDAWEREQSQQQPPATTAGVAR